MINKNKTKYMLIIAIAVISLIAVINLVSSSIYNYEWVNVEVMSQTPDPVEPGGFVDVRVKVENSGGASARNFKLEMIPEYPFSLYNEEDKVKTIVSLDSGDEYGIHYKYKIRIDEDAVEGENELKFRYSYTGANWVTVTFPINIQSPDAVVLIKQVTTEPETISHGEKAKINFKLKNIADSLVRDINLKLDLVSSSVPISPINSGTEKKLISLKPGEEKDISFDIITQATADSDVYKVPLMLSYYDELGENYNKTDVVSVIISSKADLSYKIDESEIFMSGKSGKVSVKIVNKGSEDIKFVNIKLEESNDFVLLSNKEIYVGNIDSDDYETADFDLYVEKKVKNLVLPLTIEYKDSINRKYEDKINLPVKLYTSRDAKKYNMVKSNNLAGIIVIIIIAIGGFVIYRKYKKKKKKQK